MTPVARFALLWAILSNNQLSDARSLKTDKNLENELTNSKSVKAERSHGQALERIRKERLENEELKREVEELHRQEKEAPKYVVGLCTAVENNLRIFVVVHKFVINSI